MEPNSARYDVAQGVATITVDAPKVRNALSVATMQSMLDHLNEAEDDASVGAIVITGVDDAFCAGFHLKEVPVDDGSAAIKAHFRVAALWWHQLLHKVIRIPKPVLAAVNGVAAGGGLGLALASDMAICRSSAKFVCAWHTIGIANDTATSYSLARIVGMRRAIELMMTNRVLGSAEAAEWGIVNRAYEDHAYASKAREIALELANGPTHLQALAKERFHAGWMQPVEECTEHEIQNVLSSVVHSHFEPALREFLSGQKASRAQVKLD